MAQAMTASNRFRRAKLKVKRANSHISTLIRDSSPLSKSLYEITNGPTRSIALLARPDGYGLSYRSKEPIADHFGVVIGDAVNNLREALDYSINTALEAIGQPKRVHFPFSERWQDLKSSHYYAPIERAFPEAANFILEEIKPCRDTNLPLWAAASLCNQNKHNDFIPTVSVVTVENINARIGTTVMQNSSIGGNADGYMKIIRSDQPIIMDGNFSTSVEITFPQGAIFESEPVVSTLQHMSEVVEQTLDSFEYFVTQYIK